MPLVPLDFDCTTVLPRQQTSPTPIRMSPTASHTHESGRLEAASTGIVRLACCGNIPKYWPIVISELAMPINVLTTPTSAQKSAPNSYSYPYS